MTDVSVSADGVSVTKSFETDEFPVPTVVFEVTSERGDPVTARIVDEVPEEFEMDHVGFHPDYESENWTAYPDHRVEYERRLDAGESVRTVYGVRIDDLSEGEQFLGEPQVEAELVGELDASDEEDDPVEDTTMSDIAPQDRTDVVRDVAGGDADALPGMDGAEADDDSILEAESSDEMIEMGGEEASEDDAEPEPESPSDDPLNLAEHEAATADTAADLGDSQGGDDEFDTEQDDEDGAEDDADEVVAEDDADEAAAGLTEESTDTDDEATTADGVAADSESVAAALAAEIRAGEVAEDDLAAIRDEVGGSRSTGVELEHLQSRVSELEAYTEALEAFIDENGTATQLLSSVEDDLEAIDETVSEVAADVETNTDARSQIRADVSDLRADVDAVAGVDEDVASLEERFDEMSEDVESALTDLDHLRGDLDALDERVSATEEDLDEVEDIEDDLDDLEDDIEELREWRDELTDVFGA